MPLKIITQKNFIAFAIVGVILIDILMATVFVAVNLDHICADDNCYTCAEIVGSIYLLRLFSEGSLPTLTVVLLLEYIVYVFLKSSLDKRRSDTPVELRVRMNN